MRVWPKKVDANSAKTLSVFEGTRPRTCPDASKGTVRTRSIISFNDRKEFSISQGHFEQLSFGWCAEWPPDITRKDRSRAWCDCNDDDCFSFDFPASQSCRGCRVGRAGTVGHSYLCRLYAPRRVGCIASTARRSSPAEMCQGDRMGDNADDSPVCDHYRPNGLVPGKQNEQPPQQIKLEKRLLHQRPKTIGDEDHRDHGLGQ